jgi:ABC-2 type transport system ATP-binding protein
MTPTGSGTAPPPTRIEIRNLTKRFGTVLAVDDLTFDVEPGRITGFLGPNGAGKTTTLRMALGLVRPTSGHATIGGRHYRAIHRPLLVVGSALEATGFHPGRSGRDHLRVLADTAGIPRGRADELLDMVGLTTAAKKRAGGYSMGMRQRLGLAAALIGDPRVLLLDEPANGLDPEGIRWLRGFLRRLSAEGRTILVSSHLLSEVEQTVDDVVIINNGRLVKAAPIEELHGEAQTVVRTSDPQALARALYATGGLTAVPGTDGALVVRTTDLRLIGDIALGIGLPVWELHRQDGDLESLFFSLTEGQSRNYGTATPGAAPTSVPTKEAQP